MSRLNDSQVERLLKEAAHWEPDAQMPESLIRSALARSPRRRHTPLLPALSLSGAAFAGLLAFVVFRPEVPPTIAEPTPVPFTVAKKTQPAPSAPAQEEQPAVVSKPQQVAHKPASHIMADKPRIRWNKPKRSKRTRRTNQSPEARMGSSRQELPGTLQYASSGEYKNDPKPLPENAISLDESPKIVPVVVADTDPETGEVLLRPAAAVVPDSSADAPISLE